MPPRPRRVGRKSAHNPNPNGRRGKEKDRGDNRDDDSEDYSDDGGGEEEDVKAPPTKKRVAEAESKDSKKGGDQSKDKGKDNKDKSDKNSEKEDDRVWVQCDHCQKWRALPSTVDQGSLPNEWTCEMNVYDKFNNCEEPEEEYNRDIQLTHFFKHWSRRLKDSARYTQRLESHIGADAFTPRNRKRVQEVEWIRCCNPSCGKWRAVMAGINSTTLVSRLNKSKWSENKNCVWYCSMNSWDDSTASCSAPQEALYDLPWSLGLTK